MPVFSTVISFIGLLVSPPIRILPLCFHVYPPLCHGQNCKWFLIKSSFCVLFVYTQKHVSPHGYPNTNCRFVQQSLQSTVSLNMPRNVFFSTFISIPVNACIFIISITYMSWNNPVWWHQTICMFHCEESRSPDSHPPRFLGPKIEIREKMNYTKAKKGSPYLSLQERSSSGPFPYWGGMSNSFIVKGLEIRQHLHSKLSRHFPTACSVFLQILCTSSAALSNSDTEWSKLELRVFHAKQQAPFSCFHS